MSVPAQSQVSMADSRPGRSLLPLAAALLTLIGLAAWFAIALRPDADELLAQARAALQDKRYAQAVALAERALARRPDSIDGLVIAGAAAAAQGDDDLALGFYERIGGVDDPRAAEAACTAAELLLFKQHRMQEAEKRYRRVLEKHPDHPQANRGLLNLLGVSTRRWEAIAPAIRLLQQDACTDDQLLVIGSEMQASEAPELLVQCHTASPDDPVALLGMAWHASRDSRREESWSLARRAVRAGPGLLQAHVQLGAILLERADAGEFHQWHAALPENADKHPEIWLIRGEWARTHDEPEVAVRCYWESVRLNPNYRTALYPLAQILIARGETRLAAPFLERAEKLQKLRESELALFEDNRTGIEPLRSVAARMESLGRLWEAFGWSQVAAGRDGSALWPQQAIERLRPLLDDQTPLTIDAANPARSVDLSHYPRPRWLADGRGGRAGGTSAAPSVPPITFRDDAESAGVVFTYFNGAEPAARSMRMFEFSGGGVAAFDYDVDGWPDLYLTQGCRWPPQEGSAEHLDLIFRNCEGHFEDVTASAGISENRFSTGVAAGDYDNDGFVDLFVANTGGNRLYRNNGDGSFSEATASLGLDPRLWSTSCLIADLNGDSLPDIYSLNYLQGPELFTRICQHPDGVPRMCTPSTFAGSQNQFYLNLGDGEFKNETDAAGFTAPNGKGLGVVAADFEGTGQLSLFVANDLVPNFYFRNVTPRRGAFPAMEERGIPSGLGFSAGGQALGSMGIAVDDMNQDGLLDLSITNFYLESSTLYLNLGEGVFRDATAEAGLAAPTRQFVGWGTQSIDADLDGIPDLVATNGHFDDLRPYGQPFRMRPLFFRGTGGGRFSEVAPEVLGPFFQAEHLGRGMARLDWNRDGREDVAISHIGSPAALLTNTTPNTGHFLAVTLRGVESDRDAIGTTLVLRSKAGTRTRQLTAGDGYQASNQRQLVFGLGGDTRIEELEVRWPSGGRQTFRDLPADRELLVIEGGPAPFEMNLRSE